MESKRTGESRAEFLSTNARNTTSRDRKSASDSSIRVSSIAFGRTAVPLTALLLPSVSMTATSTSFTSTSVPEDKLFTKVSEVRASRRPSQNVWPNATVVNSPRPQQASTPPVLIVCQKDDFEASRSVAATSAVPADGFSSQSRHPHNRITPSYHQAESDCDLRLRRLSQPGLARPIATNALPKSIAPSLKLVRPIPQRAVVDFYNSVAQEAQGSNSAIPGHEIQRALEHTSEWHRKWTHQDETPELYNVSPAIREVLPVATCHSNTSRFGNQITNHDTIDAVDKMLWADLLAADREKGARNPSPFRSTDGSYNSHCDDDYDHNAHLFTNLTNRSSAKRWKRQDDELHQLPLFQTPLATPASPSLRPLLSGTASHHPPTMVVFVKENGCAEHRLANRNASCDANHNTNTAHLFNSFLNTNYPSDTATISTMSSNSIYKHGRPTSEKIADHEPHQSQVQCHPSPNLSHLVRPKPLRITAAAATVATTTSNAPNPVGYQVATSIPAPTVVARPIALRPLDHPIIRQATNEHTNLHHQHPIDVRGDVHAGFVIIPTYRPPSSNSRQSRGATSMSTLSASTVGTRKQQKHGHSVCSDKKPGSTESEIGSRHSTHNTFQNGGNLLQPQLITEATDILELEQPTVHIIENDTDAEDHMILTPRIIDPSILPILISSARDGILHALAISGGETTSEEFINCLTVLQDYYRQHKDAVKQIVLLNLDDSEEDEDEGTWLTLTKPTFFGNLGCNDNGDPMYTLGRMSFDMFAPTSMICSLQGNFNHVKRVNKESRSKILATHRDEHDHYCAIPSKFQAEIENGTTIMKTYDIITPFTIELPVAAYPNAPNKDVQRPIRGIMTTYGYTLPDPAIDKHQGDRQSVWITGGRIEPNNDSTDRQGWDRLFELHPPIRTGTFGERAKLLAVKLLMGAQIPHLVDPNSGAMEYTFTRPLGGHGMAFIDTLYCDRSMRIVKGHRGTFFVFTRVPNV